MVRVSSFVFRLFGMVLVFPFPDKDSMHPLSDISLVSSSFPNEWPHYRTLCPNKRPSIPRHRIHNMSHSTVIFHHRLSMTSPIHHNISTLIPQAEKRNQPTEKFESMHTYIKVISFLFSSPKGCRHCVLICFVI